MNNDAYDRKKDDSRRRSREKSEAGLDIGEMPKCKNPERHKSCRLNLELFCTTYLAEKFSLGVSTDQRDAIKILQTIVLEGGQIALAMYRGGGKTTVCEAAALWALLYGHRKFLVIIGAVDDAAIELLDGIKYILQTFEILADDFPEAVHPILKLENEPRRCKRQTYKGELTRIKWSENEINFATIPDASSSGAILYVVGMTGRMLGLKRGNQRPDCLLIDDPQTRDSASSPTQNQKRIQIIQRQALKLAGPKSRIACMMPCTVIFPGDLVDQLTDRQKHPEWNGERRKLVHAFPTNKTWWDQYREVRADGMRTGDNGKAGTDFYLANRSIADEGAIIAWPEYTKGKASAVQYVMDEFIDDPDGASAELNNEPRHAALLTDLRQLTEEDLAVHQNTLPLGIVPRDCNKLTAFIDLGQEVLFWMVCAWSDRFGGAIIDYGSYPEQPVKIFEAANVPRPLSEVPGIAGLKEEARIYSALNKLIPILSTKSYRQQDGDGVHSISLGMIDAGKWTDTVHEYLGRSQFKALWRASKGRSIDPNSKPLNEYRKEPGDVVGWNWRIDMKTSAKGRFVSFDTRPWKSQVCNSLLAAPGSATCIYLPGDKLIEHPLLALHLLSEWRAEVTGSLTGRKVETFTVRPDNKENHWWDALIGCAVAASVSGLKFSSAMAAGEPVQKIESKPRLSFSERQKAKREARTA